MSNNEGKYLLYIDDSADNVIEAYVDTAQGIVTLKGDIQTIIAKLTSESNVSKLSESIYCNTFGDKVKTDSTDPTYLADLSNKLISKLTEAIHSNDSNAMNLIEAIVSKIINYGDTEPNTNTEGYIYVQHEPESSQS